MRTALKILLVLVGLLLVGLVGVYVWATMATSRALGLTIETHRVDFPVPFPVSADDPEAAGLDEAGRQQLALRRGVERGRHLVTARYACVECHGDNFGGGTMIDAFPIGRLLGPNLTAGRGSRTIGYTPADWDRIVRHGVLPDGRPAVMPSTDFVRMSDQELSDVVAYIRSFPPVDNDVPRPTFGPVGKVLIATGQMKASAGEIAHDQPHAELPPAAAATTEFGQHVAGVCTGCHRPDFSGGPIVGGDPSWPPARNLTSDPAALGPWTEEQFVRALREGVRPDGTPLGPPMSAIMPFAQRMTDVELQALWLYLRSLPPVPVQAP
jgi:mono/diheme cytochrome c family protein